MRLEQAEDRIGGVEDYVTAEKTKITRLEKQASELTSKVDDLENRNRHSSLRLASLPEKTEKDNAAAFLESGYPTFRDLRPAPLVIERAHRLPGAPQSSAPRVMVMKFLNFHDKIRVMQAARKKGKIMYEDPNVIFFQDIATELHKKALQ